jgi:hypothetical protein
MKIHHKRTSRYLRELVPNKARVHMDERQPKHKKGNKHDLIICNKASDLGIQHLSELLLGFPNAFYLQPFIHNRAPHGLGSTGLVQS